MVEKESTELEVVETKPTRWQRFKKFIGEHTDAAVSVVVAGIGLIGTVLGVVSMVNDHKMTKEEQEYEHGWIYDPESQMEFYVGDMTNKEKQEINRREANGESRIDILEDMGKI